MSSVVSRKLNELGIPESCIKSWTFANLSALLPDVDKKELVAFYNLVAASSSSMSTDTRGSDIKSPPKKVIRR